ncbi:MAG TPA: 4-alpha-glucanotransferase, partial [Kineosporiaceae bacterium]
LPPWNPHRLADLGCAPFRDVLRAALCGAGGVRIDHILGLFRLWWIPAGAGAAAGTYVHYDHQALLAALAVEAHRAEAMVIGEDLGTVPPYVARALSDHGILGSEVLWFARDASDPSRPRRPAEWRAAAAASVTTHDLPTAAGFLTGDHVRLRAEVGLLGHGEAVEAARAAEERQALLDLLRTEGLLPLVPDGEPLVPDGEPPDAQEIVLALHAVLARTPCQILLACPGDALGDLRQPNLPGTDRYPNWRMPLAVPTPSGPRPVPLEEFLASPATRRLAEVLRAPSGVRPGRDQPETATPPAHLASRGRSLQDEV